MSAPYKKTPRAEPKSNSADRAKLRQFPVGKYDDGPDALEMVVTLAAKHEFFHEQIMACVCFHPSFTR